MRPAALDLCRLAGRRPSAVVEDAIRAAQHCEALGYARYWVAEHHTPDAAQTSPELLVALIASATRAIRVGSGGVLLRLYSPLKVANDFALLAALYPDRIDLGLARGTCDELRAAALLGDSAASGRRDSYEAKVDALLEHLSPDAPVPAIPRPDQRPDIWLLGTGTTSAELAMRHGTSFSYSLFLRDAEPDPVVIRRYSRERKRGGRGGRPLASVALAGVCARSDADALALLEQWDLPHFVPLLVGGVQTCAEALRRIAIDYVPDEVVFVNLVPSGEDRLRGYEVFREAAELATPRRT